MKIKSKLVCLTSCLFLLSCGVPDPLDAFDFDVDGDSGKRKDSPKTDEQKKKKDDEDPKLNYGTIIDLGEIKALDEKLKKETGANPLWNIAAKIDYEDVIDARDLSLVEVEEAINEKNLNGEVSSSLEISAFNAKKKILAANYAEVVTEKGSAGQQYFWQNGCNNKKVDGNMLNRKTGLCDLLEIEKKAVKKTAITHCEHKSFRAYTSSTRVSAYLSGSEQVLCDRQVDKAVVNVKSEIPADQKFNLPSVGRSASSSMYAMISDKGGIKFKIKIKPNLGGSGECKKVFIPLKTSSEKFKIIEPKLYHQDGEELWFKSAANDTVMEDLLIKSAKYYKDNTPESTRTMDIYLACSWWLLQGEKAIEIK